LIDRVFGMNGVGDQASDHVHYGWPAMEVNQSGNMVIVYARSGATIYPEIRYSAYLQKESDIRPSRLLRQGDSYYGSTPGTPDILRWGDLAGASLDPDGETIWVVHEYANLSHSFGLYVGMVYPN
jgi:hypothetical protein